MAYQTKPWLNEEDSGATDENSVLNKTNMNDLESRILKGFTDAGINNNCKGITNQDLNTICGNANGFFSGTNLKNAPNNATNIWFKIIHISMNDVYKTQIAFNSSTGVAYYRSCVNGSWKDWIQIPLNNGIEETDLDATRGYVRFVNGLQLSWNKIFLSAESLNTQGGVFFLQSDDTSSTDYSWKKAFKVLISTFTSVNSPGYWAGGCQAEATKITSIRAYRSVQSTNPNVSITIFGLGTWK